MISGEEEARLIYRGVAHTTGGADQRLVVDIGGASTELVTGTGAQTTSLFSLSMGCVTWLERYFADRSLTKENFDPPKRLRARYYCPSPMCCAITDGKCALAPPAPFRLCRKL